MALETTSLDGVGGTSDGAVGDCVGDIVDGVDGVSASDVGHESVGGGDGILATASLKTAS